MTDDEQPLNRILGNIEHIAQEAWQQPVPLSPRAQAACAAYDVAVRELVAAVVQSTTETTLVTMLAALTATFRQYVARIQEQRG